MSFATRRVLPHSAARNIHRNSVQIWLGRASIQRRLGFLEARGFRALVRRAHRPIGGLDCCLRCAIAAAAIGGTAAAPPAAAGDSCKEITEEPVAQGEGGRAELAGQGQGWGRIQLGRCEGAIMKLARAGSASRGGGGCPAGRLGCCTLPCRRSTACCLGRGSKLPCSCLLLQIAVAAPQPTLQTARQECATPAPYKQGV